MKTLTMTVALTGASLVAQAQSPCTLQQGGARLVTPPLDGFTSSPVPLGFTFDFNGTSYDEVFVSDHGIVSFASGGLPVPNGGAATYTPGSANLDALGADCVFTYWGDHSTQGFGTPTSPDAGIWIDNTSGSYCTITWIDNEPYLGLTTGAFSNSVTLFPSGEIRVRLDSRCNNTGSTFGAIETIVGVHALNNPIPASSDLSQPATVVTDLTVYEEFVGPGPAGSNNPDPNFDLGDTTLTFTPLGSGWLVTPTSLACSEVIDAGGGCGNLTLTTTTAPSIGTRWGVELTGAQPSALPVFLSLGAPVAQTPVGAILPTLFGASCVATQDATSAVLPMPAATAGSSALSLPVPANLALVGLGISAQGLAFDLASAAEFELSNGNHVVFGY